MARRSKILCGHFQKGLQYTVGTALRVTKSTKVHFSPCLGINWEYPSKQLVYVYIFKIKNQGITEKFINSRRFFSNYIVGYPSILLLVNWCNSLVNKTAKLQGNRLKMLEIC